jgi:glutaredoxin
MCRRPSLGPSGRPSSRAREPEAPAGARVLNFAIGAAALLSLAAAVAYGFDLIPARTEQEVAPLVAEPAPSATEAARADESAEAAKKLSEEIAANEAQLRAAHQQALLAQQARLAQQAQLQQPLKPGAALPKAPDQAASATQLPDPQLAEKARAARANVSVVMYTTSWCPSCKSAREYMSAQRIAFTEHDIEQSKSAQLIMHRLNPKHSIPTIDIDGAVLVGFSAKAIEAAIDDAAHKRAARL